MPLYDDPDDAPLREAYARQRWFEGVLEAEYGEREAEGPVPDALNWLASLPVELQFGLDEAECSAAYVSDSGAYRAAVWEVTGEDDRPWLVFLVDDYGARLLPEYSVLDEETDDAALEAVLRRTAEELPGRLARGEFDREGEPVAVPEWLLRNAAPPGEDKG